MSKSRPPWDISPPLLRERLGLIARTLQRTRAELVLELRQSDKTWGPNCLAHERTLEALAKLAAEHSTWLRAHIRGQECWLLIEGIPVVFFRGKGDRPTHRALQRAVRASRNARGGTLDLFPDLDDSISGDGSVDDDGEIWRWYLAIVPADDEVSVLEVVMMQASDSAVVRNKWAIDLDAPPVPVALVSELQPPPKKLGPPPVYDRPDENEGKTTDETKRAEGAGEGKVIPFKRGAEDDERE